MWCKNCNRETNSAICEQCGKETEEDIPYEMYWCDECRVPVIKAVNAIDKDTCPHCHNKTTYLATDLRPVFPEERLLFEILIGKPLAYIKNSVWASNNRYYVDGKATVVSTAFYKKFSPDNIREQLNCYKAKNSYDFFEKNIAEFISVNQDWIT